MKNDPDVYLWKKLYLMRKYNYICPIAKSEGVVISLNYHNTDLHHYRIHNTKGNRKKYPLFIDSILNLMPVSHYWHLKRGGFGERWGPARAAQAELFLKRHKLISKWVNRGER